MIKFSRLLIFLTAFSVLLPVLSTSCKEAPKPNNEQVMLYAAPLIKTVWVPQGITLDIPSGRAGPNVDYTFTSSLRSGVPETQAVYTWKVDGVVWVDQQSSSPQLKIDAGLLESSSYPAEHEIEVEIGWIDLETGNWMRARDSGIFTVEEETVKNTGGRITCPCCGNDMAVPVKETWRWSDRYYSGVCCTNCGVAFGVEIYKNGYRTWCYPEERLKADCRYPEPDRVDGPSNNSPVGTNPGYSTPVGFDPGVY